MKNYIREYWKKIQSGQIAACRRTAQQYEKLISELDNPRDPWVFDLSAANAPIDFIEAFCRHSKGKWIGKPVRLELFQKAKLQAIYGFIHRDTGLRRCREVFTCVGRKNGKALAIDTPIPTPDGWRDMGDLQTGDYVFGKDGRPVRINNT